MTTFDVTDTRAMIGRTCSYCHQPAGRAVLVKRPTWRVAEKRDVCDTCVPELELRGFIVEGPATQHVAKVTHAPMVPAGVSHTVAPRTAPSPGVAHRPVALIVVADEPEAGAARVDETRCRRTIRGERCEKTANLIRGLCPNHYTDARKRGLLDRVGLPSRAITVTPMPSEVQRAEPSPVEADEWIQRLRDASARAVAAGPELTCVWVTKSGRACTTTTRLVRGLCPTHYPEAKESGRLDEIALPRRPLSSKRPWTPKPQYRRVLEAVVAHPGTAPLDIATALRIGPWECKRILFALRDHGLIEKPTDESYGTATATGAGVALCGGAPVPIAPLAELARKSDPPPPSNPSTPEVPPMPPEAKPPPQPAVEEKPRRVDEVRAVPAYVVQLGAMRVECATAAHVVELHRALGGE